MSDPEQKPHSHPPSQVPNPALVMPIIVSQENRLVEDVSFVMRTSGVVGRLAGPVRSSAAVAGKVSEFSGKLADGPVPDAKSATDKAVNLLHVVAGKVAPEAAEGGEAFSFMKKALPFLDGVLKWAPIAGNVLAIGDAAYNTATAKNQDVKDVNKTVLGATTVTTVVVTGAEMVGGATLTAASTAAAEFALPVLFIARDLPLGEKMKAHEARLADIKPSISTHSNLKDIANLLDQETQKLKQELQQKEKQGAVLTKDEQEFLASDYARVKDGPDKGKIDVESKINQPALAHFIDLYRQTTNQAINHDLGMDPKTDPKGTWESIKQKASDANSLRQMSVMPEGLKDVDKEIDYFAKDEIRARLDAAGTELAELKTAYNYIPVSKTDAQVHKDIDAAKGKAEEHAYSYTVVDGHLVPAKQDSPAIPDEVQEKFRQSQNVRTVITELVDGPDGKQLVTWDIQNPSAANKYLVFNEMEVAPPPATPKAPQQVTQKSASQPHHG